MKQCPTCKRNFDDDSLLFCLDDGETLVPVDEADVPQIKADEGQAHFEAPPPPATPPRKSKAKVSKAPAAAPGFVLTSTHKALIAGGVALVFAIGLIVWQMKGRHNQIVNLSPEDMALIAEDQSPQMRTKLASDEAARKDFAKSLRELLAVADAARLSKIDERPAVK